MLGIPQTKAQNLTKDFPKEKTYLQSNHVFYKPGDQMFFKITTVEAETNLPTTLSKVVNFELIGPSGSIIKKEKLEILNGNSEGYIYFDSTMKGGVYKLKAYTNWMQNEEGKNVFEKEITLQKIVSPRILMKLDYPKKGYGAGAEVQADFSMKSLNNLPISFYEAQYTVMHNGEKIEEGKLITDKDGKYQLKFNLPKILTSSDALLTIKVDYDGFTESISRNIPIALNLLNVKLLPEGGTFINGLESNIAFKITDENENPIDGTLVVYNQKNEKIQESSALKFGMGSFLMTPKIGENYYAKVTEAKDNSQIFQLPKAQNEGLVFRINKKNQSLVLNIDALHDGSFNIKGNFRGKEIYSKTINVQHGKNEITILEKDLPIGICRFTILENEKPLAERIVFCNAEKKLNLTITPSKKNYLPREKVELNIKSTDEMGKPVPSNLAVSVVDDKLYTYADDKQNNIMSWLLLDSELKGKVIEPTFYFDKKEEKANASLDLVMLTNGYRYFEVIPEVKTKNRYKYVPEKKNPIYGIVEDEEKKPVKAEVYLVSADRKIVKQVTSDNGLFYFSDLNANNYNNLVAKSVESKKKVKIRLLAYRLDINPLQKSNLPNLKVEELVKEKMDEAEKSQDLKANIDKAVRRKKADTMSKELNIEEVVVLGALGIRKETESSSIVQGYLEPINNLPSSLNGKVAGLQIAASPGSSAINVVIRGSGSISGNVNPLYVIDGVVSTVSQFQNLNANTINDIMVLKDAAATSLYGSKAANGVIVINSSKNRNPTIKFDVTPNSYYAVLAIPRDSLQQYPYKRQFAYPEYKSTNTVYRHDFREAIYWNPVVETNIDGKAKVEFYNSDANTTFRVITEGISANGLIGHDESMYASQSEISIDAKIPQYMTRTDEMHIPVVIKNNSATTKTLHMDVIVPNATTLIEADSVITLKPLEAGKLFVKIKTDRLISSNLQFGVRSGDFRETLILPFVVGEKGFPHQFSILNNKAEELSINLPETINGTLQASYLTYDNSATQLFDDLERLKREPHGCFEQLSSTVYPNIFILNYLKSSKKITPSTKALVIKNLKKGYQKMQNYKMSDGGFGYFSSSQSDVALSAFALLEFTDLKSYVAVDPKLIQRLSSFILSKKNANGLFVVKGKYEKEFSEHAWSRNAYVIYALSKLGFGAEIENSYQVSLARAMATKNNYQLALLANASHYLKKDDDYAKITFILNEAFDKNEKKSEVTFTGSGGISAHSETLALSILALQKKENNQKLQITKWVDQLIANSGYYGFGSTQATALAVEAHSQYYTKNDEAYGVSKPIIKINNVVVQPNSSLASALRVGENKINIGYEGNIGLPYKLSYEYYTLQAPKSVDIPVSMSTTLQSAVSKVGETNRLSVKIENKINNALPMTIAKIGIPAGLTLQNALLKDLVDKKEISYYEIFDNYLVLYWESLEPNEKRTINLDLKVEFPGKYTGKASTIYLYYLPESKVWNEGLITEIKPN